ncbi:MAG: hypothetical protein HOB40_10045 [Candidatus Marinimicrobia bacterium]|jgi:uncharacterized membrane protein YfcA|nr:hypothetical protein [Candidatus Neomarinimicrobiota bacterium]MBT3502754.1 hypothetical protein [Candidatus Neomarinimicrobiota bacterium]MBT3838938.1 hypothetical protein [Candidatus Neomarinimicrobiota bacterium]MBT4000362.1 hypothetical protein [Candidatus Neomarinimicrobiota bacterium]MBT4283434.1 hypothetical protein [Candidatus Neomarinimicrobiota bacterium]
MKPIILVGTITITLSLVLYSIAIITILKNKKIRLKDVILLTVGIISEITAVICMAIGSTQPITTPHGLVGLAGLIIMILVVVMSWKLVLATKKDVKITNNYKKIVLSAYSIWIMAYISGVITGMSHI